jgi:hypothetical protein
MEKIVTQEEIGALFRSTRQGKAKQKNISNFDIRTAGQIGKDQKRALSAILKPSIFTCSR